MERARLNPPKRRKTRENANRKHFTEDNVLALRSKKDKQYLIWDMGTDAARGLAILVSPTGTKSYRAVYYFPGSVRPHYKHLGRVGEMTLDQARIETRKARGDAKKGIDPKADSAAADSFEAAVKKYITDRQIAKKGNSSAPKTQALMLRSCKEWLPRSAATIRGGEIEHLLSLIRDGDKTKDLKPRPYLANRLYSHLKDFFTWCARPNTGSIKMSPMIGVELPFDKMAPRDPAWAKGDAADSAIRALWKAADEIGGNEGKYVKMMLLLGKRKTALASMLWEEIKPDGFWDAPPSKSKNKRLHGVPLPRLAQRVLGQRQQGQTGKVFDDLPNLDRLQSKLRTLTGIEGFFWHGVRHLCETKTADLHIPPHIRDLLFDHSPDRGSGAGYDHSTYRTAMGEAMETWAKHVERLVGPEGVAVLR